MSLITQCPACATMFRVVPDQLRISEGWVRCGQCEEVFDANAHLRTLNETSIPAPLEQQPLPAPPIEAPFVDALVAPPLPDLPEESEGEYDWGPLLAPQVSAAAVSESLESRAPISQWDAVSIQDDDLQLELPPPVEAVGEAPEPNPEIDAFLQHNPHDAPVAAAPMDEQAAPELAHDWLHPAQQSPVTGVDALAEEPPADGAAAQEQAQAQPQPSFMAPSEGTQKARRWLGSRVLVALSVMLSLALAMQLVLHERDRISATAPALRPALTAGCAVLGCTISAPQQIESIAIESSAFTSLKPGVYVLSMTLKNAAAIDLAAPALELTLTDMQDHPLLRRVILPIEFSGKPQLVAGAELSANLPISVVSGAATEKIAGYKLLAFYP